MNKDLTLTQVLETANELLLAEELRPFSVSSLRHYTSSDVLPKPRKQGKEARYDKDHIDSMVALRRSQRLGVSAKAHAVATNYLAEVVNSTGSLSQRTPTLSVSPASSIAGPGLPEGLANRAHSDERCSAINFLKRIDAKLESPHTIRKLTGNHLSKEAIYSSAAAFSDHAEASGITGLVAAAAVSTLSALKPPNVEFSRWNEYDIHPGVKLQLRPDLIESFSDAERQELTRTITKIFLLNKGM